MSFRPMLAGECNIDAIQYPVYVSPKLDGIRCVIRDGKALTRSLKPIPNDHIRNVLESLNLPDFDGELLIRSRPGMVTLPNFNAPFNEVSSAVMRKEGTPDFLFAVFDQVMDGTFTMRLNSVYDWLRRNFYWADGCDEYHIESCKPMGQHPNIEYVDHAVVKNREQLDAHNAMYLEHGFEGTMIRKPDGPYKQGRSTTKEGYLLKLKPFDDGEAVIIGYVEQMSNQNEATTNALGLTERSTNAEGMVPAGTLGTLVVRGVGGQFDGVQFEIGTGFTASQRQQIWDNRPYYTGAMVKFKYQKHGSVDRPRIPVFLAFRYAADL